MAAPAHMTMHNLSGRWALNKGLSDNPDPAFAVQGMGYLTRKAIGLAPVTLELKQYQAPPGPPSASDDPTNHIDMTQLAAGLKGVQEPRCLDNEVRDNSDWLFGATTIQSKWVKPEEVEDEYLKDGWLTDNEVGDLVYSVTRSKGDNWVLTQVWGFRKVGNERRYCRRVVVVKGSKRAAVEMVHDYSA